MTHRRSHAKPLKAPQSKPHESPLGFALLCLCLGILALRCTVTESPVSRLSTLSTNLHDLAYSLTLSMLLLIAAGIWAIRVLHGKTRTCKTYLELGISLFVFGGLIAAWFASDQRAALSDLLVLVAPMAMAWLLIQLLNTPAKIRLTLALIAVLGLLSAYESYNQFTTTNQETITAYEKEPAQFLEPLGVSRGTFEHFLFEHRLYSQGVRSFFTTRNSNGSFLLMAILAALALTIEGVIQYKQKHNTPAYAVAALLVTLINLNALILTKSKGALGGLTLACLGLGLLYAFGKWLRPHARMLIIICVIGLVVMTGSFIYYGQTHDTLPGGNSLLVRWQYWQATTHMITQHPWVGVGPGNFAQAYHQFKPAASPESVADPHNWVLSLLSQYGPLGMMGFVLALAWPLVTVTQWHKETTLSSMCQTTEAHDKKLYWGYTFAICTWLLLVKPMMGMIIQDTLPVIVLTCLVHTLMLCVGMLVLLSASAGQETDAKHNALPWAAPVLACCILALLAANMLDFALFEPSVLTCFWTLVACVVASQLMPTRTTCQQAPPPSPTRWSMTGMIVGVLLLCVTVGYMPLLLSTTKIYRANQAWAQNKTPQAHQLLDQAARLDWLSDAAFYQNGRMFLNEYRQSSHKDDGLLLKAKACFEKAIHRNPGAYRNYEKLTDVCSLTDPNTAVKPAQQAIELYPGNARLQVKLAMLYDQLGQLDLAKAAYQAALDIEESFQRQFKLMYPDEPQIHRLAPEYLNKAVERVGQGRT